MVSDILGLIKFYGSRTGSEIFAACKHTALDFVSKSQNQLLLGRVFFLCENVSIDAFTSTSDPLQSLCRGTRGCVAVPLVHC